MWMSIELYSIVFTSRHTIGGALVHKTNSAIGSFTSARQLADLYHQLDFDADFKYGGPDLRSDVETSYRSYHEQPAVPLLVSPQCQV